MHGGDAGFMRFSISLGLLMAELFIGLALINVAVSAATSAASFGVARLFAPKPPTVKRGKLEGDLFLQNSAYGQIIPKFYGAEPGDGKGGGVVTAGNILWTSGVRKKSTTKKGGKGPRKPDVEEITYDVDMGVLVGVGPLTIKRIWANTELIYNANPGTGENSGIYDDTQPGDSSYNHFLPPSPLAEYTTARYNGDAAPDGNGIIHVTSTAGNYASVTIYPGNDTQTIDPVIQADVDGKKGAGNTPAYRGRCYVVFEKYNLSKFGGVIPNFTFEVEHQTLKTLDLICEDLCASAGLQPSDYNFANLSGLKNRGYVVNGRQSPRVALELLGRIHGAEFYEDDGVVRAVQRGTQTPIIVMADDLGVEEGSPRNESDAPLQLIDSTLRDEPGLPKTFEVKYFDPRRDGQSNLHREGRFVQRTERADTLDIPATLIPSEARLFAQRELYRLWTERNGFEFSLPWKYGYLKPTDVVSVSLGGFGYSVFVRQIAGTAPGVLRLTGVADEVSVYSPAGAGDGGDGYSPFPVDVPPQTVATLFNLPYLRPDAGSGYYAAAASRGAGTWKSAGLFKDSGLGFEQIASWPVQCTMGVAVGALAAFSGTGADSTNTVTVDLYFGALESVTTAELDAGANLAILGEELIQFGTAAQVAGLPNRWTLSVLRRGLKQTQAANSTHQAGERFALIDSAVVFVPALPTEAGISRTYKAVTEGQTLDDAASFTYTWPGDPNAVDIDTDVPNINKITAAKVASKRRLPDDKILVNLQISIPGRYTDPAANASRIDAAEVTTYNKFGTEIVPAQFVPFGGDGLMPSLTHPRRDCEPTGFTADPPPSVNLPEATYKIRLRNRFGLSAPIWIQGAGFVVSAPTYLTQTSSHPQNLRAVPTGQTTVDLTWDYTGSGQQNIAWYSIPTDATPNTAAAGAIASVNGQYTVTNLDPNTTYDFRVNEGTKFSNITAAKTFEGTGSTAFPAPTGLSATANDSTKITLTWTRNSTTNTAVQVWRGGSLLTTISDPTTTTYADETVAANTGYTYKLRHVYGGSYSAFTADASATTPSATFPAPLTRANSGWNDSAGANKYRFAWVPNTKSTQLTGFEIWRNSALVATINDPAQWFFNDAGLSASTSYTYQVKNKFGGSTSALSSSVSATTKSTGNPNAPTSLAATVVSGTQIDLTWTRNSTLNTATSVIWTSADNIDLVNSASLAATATSHSITGLTPGATYHITVAHYENSPADTSIYSNEVVATTQSGGASTPAPTNLQATANGANQVDLAWTRNSTTNTGTEIYRSVAGGTEMFLTVVAATATSYSNTGLQAGTQYTYRIRHTYSGGLYSGFAGPASATTTGTAFPAPSNLSATALSSTAIRLNWLRNSTTNTAVQVRRGTISGITNHLATIPADATTYDDTTVSPNTTYYYVVRNSYGNDNSSPSNQASAATPSGSVLPPPRNLVVTAINPTQIDLVWDKNSTTHTSGEVWRQTGAGGPWELITTVNSGTQIYNNTGLQSSTTYTYRIRNTYSGGLYSEYSNTSSATTPAAASYPPPTSPSAVSASQSQLNLSWTRNSTTNIQTEIYRVNGAFTSLLATVDGAQTTYSDTGLSASTTYTYRMRHVYPGGFFSVFTSDFQGTTGAQPNYTPPTNVQVSASTPGQVGVTWTRNSTTNTNTEVWREEFGGTNQTLLAAVGATATSYNDTTGTAGTTYYYKVRHEYGAGNYSAFAASGSISFPSAFPPPTNLSATAPNSTQVNLTWTRNSTTNTETEISRDGILPITVPGTQTAYTDTFVLPNETHVYQVRHKYGGVYSAFSNTATVNVPNGPLPVPVNFTGVAASDTQINLSWTRTSTANVGFQLYRNGALLTGALAANATSYSDTGLSAATAYTYKIRAEYPSSQFSDFTPDATITTLVPATPAPTNLRVTALDPFFVGLAWNRNSTTNTKAQVWRKTGAGGTYSQIADLSPSIDTYTDTSALPNTTYYYKIRHRYAGGIFSDYSNEVSATTPPDSGGL